MDLPSSYQLAIENTEIIKQKILEITYTKQGEEIKVETDVAVAKISKDVLIQSVTDDHKP